MTKSGTGDSSMRKCDKLKETDGKEITDKTNENTRETTDGVIVEKQICIERDISVKDLEST